MIIESHAAPSEHAKFRAIREMLYKSQSGPLTPCHRLIGALQRICVFCSQPLVHCGLACAIEAGAL